MEHAIITAAIRVLEFVFFSGIVGSAIVVLLVTIQDVAEATRRETPESASPETDSSAA